MIEGQRVFVDANVLAYALLGQSKLHKLALECMNRLHYGGTSLCISSQVFREVLVVLTKPGYASKPLAPATAVMDLSLLAAQFTILEDGPHVRQQLVPMVGELGIAGQQVHDANIAATMLAHGVKRLLTHNARDFSRYAHLLQVENII